MMWAAGTLAALSSLSYPAISALISCNADSDQQGKHFVVFSIWLLKTRVRGWVTSNHMLMRKICTSYHNAHEGNLYK